MNEISLLLVDDEANILSALKRLFRPLGYRTLTAESGKEGLSVLEREKVDLVISDMRMPEMNGAQFLEQVRLKHPDTVRILLTGYADIGSTIDAINKGQIYRYISKPWEDNDIVLAVKHALERKFLEQEKLRLEEITRRQNEELKALNAGLESKVQARTEELRQANSFLELANKQLKDNFLVSLKVFSNLIELRGGAIAGHSRRVAEYARKLAQAMGLGPNDIQDILFAALLHDIGKIGLPDRIIGKPYATLTPEEKAEMAKHPKTGQAALMGIENLRNASRYIRGHHERFDGKGFPDGLQGLDIPLGARILAVANDYDSLIQGGFQSRRLSEKEACTFLIENRQKLYDPALVDAFIKMLGIREDTGPTGREMKVTTDMLKPLMVLSRDLVGEDGLLLLAKDYVLEDTLIAQIRGYEDSVGCRLDIRVRA